MHAFVVQTFGSGAGFLSAASKIPRSKIIDTQRTENPDTIVNNFL